jgi:hypothetical protein
MSLSRISELIYNISKQTFEFIYNIFIYNQLNFNFQLLKNF